MLAILFEEKTKKNMLVFPKNGEKNASIIEKGLVRPRLERSDSGWKGLTAAVRAEKELAESEMPGGGMGGVMGRHSSPLSQSRFLLSSFFLLSLFAPCSTRESVHRLRSCM